MQTNIQVAEQLMIMINHLTGVVTLVCVVEGGDGAGVSMVTIVPALVNVQPRHHEVHHEQPDQVAAAGGR